MWFLVALIVGGLIGALILWARSRDIKVAWYAWLIGVAGLLMLLFTVQNYFGSLAESKPEAAGMFWVVTGLPSIVLIGIASLIVWRRQRAS